MNRAKKGFTLVELIIVIAIIAVLVVILVPQYAKYLTKARETVCQKNLDEAARAYEIARVDAQAEGGEIDGAALMKEVVEGMGGAESKARLYTGLCPEDGTVAAVFDADGGVTLSCSKHADAVGKSSVYSTKLLSVVMGNPVRQTKSGSQKLLDYLKDKHTIDSEAGLKTAENDPTWTSIINGQMESLAAGQSWQIVGGGNGKSCTIYVTTDGSIADSKNGAKVPVRKYVYTFADGKMADAGTGTATIETYKKTTPNYNRIKSVQ